MKTKTFLLLCLFLGIGLTQLSAQNDNSWGTKSVQGWFQGTYYSPVYCGDEMVDYLEGGWLRVHDGAHYKNGKFIWETDQLKGEVTSVTGEVFKVIEIDKTYFTDHWYVTWKFSLMGNWGSHYVGSFTYSYWTGETIPGKAICN